jgi:hypothetical protein
MSALNKFLEKGAQVLCFDYIHAKFIFASNENRGIIMTANFDNLGLEEGYEIGINLNQNECSELNKITSSWINNAQYNYLQGDTISEIGIGKIKIFENNEIKNYEIIDEKIVKDYKNPKDLREFEALKELDYKGNFIYDTIIPKKITIEREITPPVLPSNSTKVKDNSFPFDLYIHKNQQYLVIKNERQLKEAVNKFKHNLRNIILVTG